MKETLVNGRARCANCRQTEDRQGAELSHSPHHLQEVISDPSFRIVQIGTSAFLPIVISYESWVGKLTEPVQSNLCLYVYLMYKIYCSLLFN